LDSGRIGGTSTITQQLARNFFLTPDRLLKRKLTEIFIALLLEQRFNKQDILKLYANETYMGQRGSFSINGFGEAAAAYFGKDLSSLSLSESATLVAMIPAPNGKYSPIKHPDEVKRRRNAILGTMRSLNKINDQQLEEAKKTEIKVVPLKIDASDAPYSSITFAKNSRRISPEEQITEGRFARVHVVGSGSSKNCRGCSQTAV
jgi:penicillin-binding protein 1B